MEKKRLEVVLEATNNAGQALAQYANELERVIKLTERLSSISGHLPGLSGMGQDLHQASTEMNHLIGVMERIDATLHDTSNNIFDIREALKSVAPAANEAAEGIEKAAKAQGSGFGAKARGIIGIPTLALPTAGTLVLPSLLGGLGMVASLAGQAVSALAGVAGEIIHIGVEVVKWIAQQAVNALMALVDWAKRGVEVLAVMGAAATATGLALATLAVKEAGEMQRWTAEFSVLMGGMKQAKAEIKLLEGLEPKIPFTIQQLVEADRMLKAFSIDLGGTEATLKTFGDAAAGTGNDLETVIRAYMRLREGNFSTRLMVPLGLTKTNMKEAGATSLRSATGMSDEEMQGRGEEMAAAALKVWSKYAGMGDVIMGTLSGRMTNLRSAWTRLLEEVGGPLLTPAIDGLNLISDTFTNLRVNGAESFGEALARVFGPILTDVAERAAATLQTLAGILSDVVASDRFAKFVATLQTAFDMAANVVGGWLDWLAKNWEQVWDWVAKKVGAAVDFIIPMLSGLWGVLTALWKDRGAIAEWAKSAITAAIQVGYAIETEVIRALRTVWGYARDMMKDILGPAAGILSENAAHPERPQLMNTIIGASKGSEWGKATDEKMAEWERRIGTAARAAPYRIANFIEQNTAKGTFGGNLIDAYNTHAQEGTNWVAARRGAASALAVENAAKVLQYGAKQVEDGGEDLQQAAAEVANPTRAELMAAQFGSKGAAGIGAGGVGGGGGTGGGGGSGAIEEFWPDLPYFQAAADLAEQLQDTKGSVAALELTAQEATRAYNELLDVVRKDPTTTGIKALTELLKTKNEATKKALEAAGGGYGGANTFQGHYWLSQLGTEGRAQLEKDLNERALKRLTSPDPTVEEASREAMRATRSNPYDRLWQKPVQEFPHLKADSARPTAEQWSAWSPGVTINVGTVSSPEQMKAITNREIDKFWGEQVESESIAAGNPS